jgi:hypothetical protein
MRVLILAAAFVVAVFSQACEKKPLATRVDVEVFVVGLAQGSSETLRFIHRNGELILGENPDVGAKKLAANAANDIVLIHSTSWRWETDGRIVLTYLAWAKDGTIGHEAESLPQLAPPGPTDPLNPRPPEIRRLDPLAHGLRHLAFLLSQSTGAAVATALGTHATAVLKTFSPEIAGKLEERP